MKKQTISLCMIVKNEEKFLPRCLESVKDYVDEMIIVDTGSTDKTKEIAKSFGAIVFDHEWKDDFSEARNVALQKATSDWILQLDADEYFMQGTQSKIPESIEKHQDKKGLLIQITNLVLNGQIGNSHVSPRLFKRAGAQYRGHIHEQIMIDGETIIGEYTDIRIIHSGYMEEVVKEKGKKIRNLAILKKELEKDPNNGFHNYNMSNEYLATKKYEKALEYAQRAYQNGRNSTYEANCVLNIVWSLFHLKRYDDALKVLSEATQVYQKYTDLYFIQGLVLEEQGRTFEAKEMYRKCVELGESEKGYYTRKGIGNIIPAEKLTEYSIAERDFDTASKLLILLASIHKKNYRYAAHLANMLKRTMTDEELYNYLEEAYIGTEFDELRQMLYRELGVKKGISLIPIKKELEIDIQLKSHWFNNRLDEATEICLKGLEIFKNKMLPVAITYYFHNPTNEVKETIVKMDKTAKLLVDAFNGQYDSKKINYDEEIYIRVLKELIDLKEYETFEKLYEVRNLFQPKTLKTLGELFYMNYFDDLAIECWVDYLQKNENDAATWLKTAELLYVSDKYQEAIVFADMASKKGNKSFHVIEIILESLKKLGEYEEVLNVCQIAIEKCPNSTYLMETIERTM